MAARRVLRECRIFAGLSEGEEDRIAALAVPKEFGAGATIFSEGSPAEAIYVLEKGRVALQMQLPGERPQVSRRVTVDVVSEGEAFGWSAAVARRLYTLSAMCLEPTRVLALDGAKLNALFQEDYRIGYKVMSQLIDVVASRLDETRRVLVSERLVVLPV